MLGGASARELQQIERISVFWGLGYQIVDDLKDVLQSSAQTGKTPARDVVLDRPNIAAVIGIHGAVQRLTRLIDLGDRVLRSLLASRPGTRLPGETARRTPGESLPGLHGIPACWRRKAGCDLSQVDSDQPAPPSHPLADQRGRNRLQRSGNADCSHDSAGRRSACSPAFSPTTARSSSSSATSPTFSSATFPRTRLRRFPAWPIVAHANPVLFGIVSSAGHPIITCFGVTAYGRAHSKGIVARRRSRQFCATCR